MEGGDEGSVYGMDERFEQRKGEVDGNKRKKLMKEKKWMKPVWEVKLGVN